MREIKFRAKTLKQDIWCYGSYFKHIKRQVGPIGDSLKDEDIEHLMIIHGFADWNMPIPIEVIPVKLATLGQFTGLCDKTGKQIYEGDIVKKDNGPVGKVIFERGQFSILFPGGFLQIKLYPYCKDVVVIGNIYDNFELIEDEYKEE